MKSLFVGTFLAISLFEASEGQRGFHTNEDTNTCDARVYDQCLTPGSSWDGGSACSAVYGGFNGNQHNLNVMMKNHFRDSFKFLIMVNIHKYVPFILKAFDFPMLFVIFKWV